ncbi:phospholipase A and acyltransferase 3-like isoform X2 [Nelusetta ayraudi]|uniref:phospholipase A and acyltransferase 3-like isoform X2 n=1 Tax=Nelusetta ayraudi TaxID=303726 RepID=UPI003F7232D5
MAPPLSNKKPKPGDLIEVRRNGYQHWALYVGDESVVHLTSKSGVSSRMSVGGDKGLIQNQKLCDVVGSNRWKINNVMDKKYKPRPADDIVRDGRALLSAALCEQSSLWEARVTAGA